MGTIFIWQQFTYSSAQTVAVVQLYLRLVPMVVCVRFQEANGRQVHQSTGKSAMRSGCITCPYLSPVERREFVKTAMDGSTGTNSVQLHTPKFGLAVCAFGNDSCLAALLHVRTQSVRASSLVIRLRYV